MRGDPWKGGDDFIMFRIYTPAFTISLESDRHRGTELLAIYSLPLGTVFLMVCTLFT